MSKEAAQSDQSAKRAYVAPVLVEHGSVRNLTGGSGGRKGDLGVQTRL